MDAKLRQACELCVHSGIDATAVVDTVIKLAEMECAGQCVELVVLADDAPDRALASRTTFARLGEQIKVAARGTYAIVERKHSDKSTYHVILSDGTGEIAMGGRFNVYTSMPQPGAIIRTLFEYEIHACLEYCALEAKKKEARTTIEREKFCRGQSFSIAGHGFDRATAEIISVDVADGNIRYIIKKLGRHKQFELPAHEFMKKTCIGLGQNKAGPAAAKSQVYA